MACESYCITTDFGAKFDGSDDTKAWIEAMETINAAGGGTLWLPRGESVTVDPIRLYSNILIRGQGRNVTKVKNSVTDLFVMGNSTAQPPLQFIANLTLMDFTITSDVGGGHVFLLTGQASRCTWTQMRIIQNNTAKSIFKSTNTEEPIHLNDSLWDHCYLIHLPNATVSAFDMSAPTPLFNRNTLSNLRCWHSGTAPFFRFETGTGQANSSCVMKQINFENCRGGMVRWGSAANWKCTLLVQFDLTAILGDGLVFARGSAFDEPPPCNHMTLIGCDRRSTALPAGKFDIRVEGDGGKNIVIVNGYENSATPNPGHMFDANGRTITWLGIEGRPYPMARVLGRSNCVFIGGAEVFASVIQQPVP